MKKLACVFLLSAVISGCVDIPSPAMTIPFNDAEFAPYRQKGTASITGQAFSKTRGGEVRYGAGETVTLTPMTSYSTEIINARKFGIIKNTDGKYFSSLKTTTTDATGNFEFKEIPAGSYYIDCPIYWEVPGAYGMTTTGGIVRKTIHVSDGEQLKIMLTD